MRNALIKADKKIYLLIAAVFVAVAAFAIYAGGGISGSMVSQDQATQGIKGIYRLLTGTEPEILSVKEESGIYKVVLRTADSKGASNVQDIFVTKDGKFVTDKLLDAEAYKKSLESSRDFVDCLSGKGVSIVGLTTDNYTVAQMQALGDFGYRIYFDCAGSNLQACQQIGIKNIPSMIYNSTIYEGFKTVEWIEQTTECQLRR